MTQLHGVTAVHVGQLVPDITRVETAETRLRPSASTIEYSFALLVEGIGVNELEATAPDVIGHLKNTVSGTYETRWAKYSRRSLREAVGTRIIGRGLHGFWMDSSHILCGVRITDFGGCGSAYDRMRIKDFPSTFTLAECRHLSVRWETRHCLSPLRTTRVFEQGSSSPAYQDRGDRFV